MNERIKEQMNTALIERLLDIAAFAVPGVYTIEYESGNKGVELTEIALAKFVELIIIECIDAILDTNCEDTVDDNHAAMYAATLQQVKQHFGVQ